MKISYVIPSYNETESLEELIRRISSVSSSQRWDFEIFVIDDGSTDSSFALLKKLQAGNNHLHAVRFRRNLGKSIALSAGFTRAQGDIIVMMDADLQDEPEDVPHLVKKIQEGYDAVTGWKVKRHDPWHKVIPSRVINAIVRKLFGIRIHDMNCGLKAFTREVVSHVPLYGELYRYILLFAHTRGFLVTEIPTTHHARKHGYSKFGVSRFFRGFVDLFTVYFLTRYAKRPLHFFGGVGFVLSFIGFVTLIYLTGVKLSGESIGNRPLLLFGVLVLLVGIQFFATGFVAELLISERPKHIPSIREEF